MSFVSAGISLTSILTAASAAVGGITAIAGASYQAKVAEMNQQIAQENAVRARDRASVEAQDQDALTLEMLGEQLAVQSASGLSTDSRSSVLARKTAAELGRKDTLNVKQAGDIEAYNYETDSANFAAQGASAKASSIGEALQGFLGATGSLLGGARSVRNRERYVPTPYGRPQVLA